MYGEDCAEDCQERAECKRAGERNHWQCGWCKEHDRPKHHCGFACLPPMRHR